MSRKDIKGCSSVVEQILDGYDIREVIKETAKFGNLEVIDEANLEFTVDNVSDDYIVVSINGKVYWFRPEEGSARELGQKVQKMTKFSKGRALAYLKKHATTNDSYRKGKVNASNEIK